MRHKSYLLICKAKFKDPRGNKLFFNNANLQDI